jgi:hypothetical protein
MPFGFPKAITLIKGAAKKDNDRSWWYSSPPIMKNDAMTTDAVVRQPIDYLLLGSVTQDITPGGNQVLGGTAAFSGCMAHALGMRVGIVAAIGPGVDLSPLDGISVMSQLSHLSTTYENCYTESGRVQYLRQRADPLRFESVPIQWLTAPIVHLGPLADDIDPSSIVHFPDAFVGVTPQGWLRQWDDSGRVSWADWPQAQEVLAVADVVVLSIEDVGGDWAYLENWAKWVRVLVVTQGEKGATVYARSETRQFPAPCVRVVDPTGAGDLFAAAFFVRYQQSGDPWGAARFAVSLASASVTRPGLAGLPTRAEIETSPS